MTTNTVTANDGSRLEGELWSFLVSVLSQGVDIHLDHQNKTSEEYYARRDAAARERVPKLLALLAAAPTPPELMNAQTSADKTIFTIDPAAFELLRAACKTGNEGAIRLAAQLAGVPPCDKCGYVRVTGRVQHSCRCPLPAPPTKEPSA